MHRSYLLQVLQVFPESLGCHLILRMQYLRRRNHIYLELQHHKHHKQYMYPYQQLYIYLPKFSPPTNFMIKYINNIHNYFSDCLMVFQQKDSGDAYEFYINLHTDTLS
ncbi:hypothetical protein MCCL_1135 [Macrococcoides caseolyticum JCSC5402]|uniref:Uncharacterized protein n=1 Tax=Macrococcus caseolyticus (strain JCSC5402) TaxID=458233 RepID=B9E6M4_MACCJ|nr:hypothetical protein MCCL_1135 [Macrococcus caseolyticus JCSC5402]